MKRTGFTLIDLLVVIAIVAILVASLFKRWITLVFARDGRPVPDSFGWGNAWGQE